jgi:hypothetical protein
VYATTYHYGGDSPEPLAHFSKGISHPTARTIRPTTSSKPADLSTFFIALLNDGEYQGARILDAPMAAEMQRFQFNDANRPENFPATEGNSGLLWRTKFNGQRVGHGGNDPGLQREMLADLSKHVGVILFLNTSLSGLDQCAMATIFNALWKHGESFWATR